jgi:hypothetical protein
MNPNITPLPLPLMIDQANQDGVEVKDGRGDMLYFTDFSAIPEERGSAFYNQIVEEEIAKAKQVVLACNSHAQLVEALKEVLGEFGEVIKCIAEESGKPLRETDAMVKAKALLSTLEESK